MCPMPRLPDPDAARKLAQESDAHQKRVADEVATKADRHAKLKGERARLNTRITNLEGAISSRSVTAIVFGSTGGCATSLASAGSIRWNRPSAR